MTAGSEVRRPNHCATETPTTVTMESLQEITIALSSGAIADPYDYGFEGQRIEWRYFLLHQIQVGGRPPSWVISNGHIAATTHSIHLYSAHCAVIFAIAQLSCIKSLTPVV